MSEKKQRVQFDLTPEVIKEIDRMMRMCGFTSRVELFRYAFGLFHIVLDETARGARLVLETDNKPSKVILLPFIRRSV